MKFHRILAAAIAVTFLTATTVFSASGSSNAPQIGVSQQKGNATKMESKHTREKGVKQKCDSFSKDPLKVLQSKKEKIKSLLKEKKITKEKADAMTARIDAMIKEIQKYDSLPLQGKRDVLINNFKASVDKRVKNGRLTQDVADTMVKDFTDKITKWDGKGYPQFQMKGFKDKGKHRGTDSK